MVFLSSGSRRAKLFGTWFAAASLITAAFFEVPARMAPGQAVDARSAPVSDANAWLSIPDNKSVAGTPILSLVDSAAPGRSAPAVTIDTLNLHELDGAPVTLAASERFREIDNDPDAYRPPDSEEPDGEILVSPSDVWEWQQLPQGLIYRSYWAGVKEPRFGIQLMHETDGHSFWDPTVGTRLGLLRYGTAGGLHPEGWEWDVEGAAEPRLTLDQDRDLETVDFRAGTLATYGISNWQFKFGYYHLSSHLGDEFAIKHPGSLDERINYVRDSLILGASFYPNPILRVYGESAWAFNPDGGAKPWEFQFGTEFSEPGPTGRNGTAFLALNGHLRQEFDFSGDFTAQIGRLWRTANGQTFRLGLHYLNGKSSQYQSFSKFEQQIGVGAWYDF